MRHIIESSSGKFCLSVESFRSELLNNKYCICYITNNDVECDNGVNIWTTVSELFICVVSLEIKK